jgi:hypothetical protein
MTIQSKRATTRTLQALFLFAALTACVLVPSAHGQVSSNAPTVTLTATLSESLTVSATPSTVTFALNAGSSAAGNAPVAITTTWVLAASRANLYLYGYFSSASQALQGVTTTTIYIPSSEVFGAVSTGVPTTATAFTQTAANGLTVGTAGASLELLDVTLSSSNYSGTRTDNLTLSIDLTSQPQLAAQQYSGTLYLQAQAL